MISVSEEKDLILSVTVREINIHNADDFLAELKKAANSNTDLNIILNLIEVRLLDSSAIAKLVSFVQLLAASRRKLTIVNVASSVRNAINVLKLAKFLNIK